jgi:hypothetical protein
MTQRVPGFAPGKRPDEGWITVKVQLRPSVHDALKNEAQAESDRTGRQVYVSDLLRDGVLLLLTARRALPGQEQRFTPAPAEPRFKPSDKSEPRARPAPVAEGSPAGLSVGRRTR